MATDLNIDDVGIAAIIWDKGEFLLNAFIEEK